MEDRGTVVDERGTEVDEADGEVVELAEEPDDPCEDDRRVERLGEYSEFRTLSP